MIVDLRPDQHGRTGAAPVDGTGALPAGLSDDFDMTAPEEPTESAAARRVALAVALIAVVAWIAGALWFARDALPTLTPVAVIELIAALVAVPALVGIVWLLAMRTSRSEARRFVATAAAMRAEAASLERTAAAVSHTLDANRAKLAEQINQLMAMGDAATEHLGSIGRAMAGQVLEVNAHASRLADVAQDAQSNVSVLLASLPHARSETEQVAMLLDRTGLSAGEHAASLDAQLVALAERGREADAIAGGAAGRLAAHITRMEATGETAGTRLEAVTEQMSDAVDALLGRTADAVDEARKGIAAQGDAMLAMVGAHQAALDRAAHDSADQLAERIAAVEGAIEHMTVRLDEQRSIGTRFVADLEQGLAGAEAQLDALHTQGVERSRLLAASINALGTSADAMTESLKAGEALATSTIGTTESLLIALDAAAREIDETLPEALARLDDRIGQSKTVVVQAKPELFALVTAAESTHDAIEAIAGVIAEQRRTLDTLSTTLLDTLTSGRSKADALGEMVEETIGRTTRFSDESAPKLMEALLKVRETASAAADEARDTLAVVIPEAAQAIEAASAEAMRRATGDAVTRQLAALTDAADAAVGATAKATERLAGQVQAVLDQAHAVEERIQVARSERDDAEQTSLSRQVSVLIETLHSASIDIAKAFAPDIADSAWAAYLKGDRGVFTRRAVRILGAGDAQDVARLYDADDTFRERVNRYIHDFESMLRAILTQPEGSALSITLLSSDMGKLYVALAQAIERLR